jgi:chromosome partitioning protein
VRRIAITNEKGGSVKTTTAVSLAAALAECGRRVLLIDLDGQANATSWLAARPAGELLDTLLTGTPITALARPTSSPGVDAIAATPGLKAAETTPRTEPGAEQLMRGALEALPHGRWDYLLMDCPPTLWTSIIAMTAADKLLVPVEASYLALEGLTALTGTMAKIRQRLNPRLRLAGVLLCRVDPRVIARPRSANELEQLVHTRFGGDLFDSRIRECIRLKEAPSHRQPITTYAPESTAACDYRAAASELEARA